MKMVFVVYSRAADYDVIKALKDAGITAYTKMERACGEGLETDRSSTPTPGRGKTVSSSPRWASRSTSASPG
ncbi:MAG TPA: hypothetical protein PLQ43_12690 [Deltaproteobacteria bacterium]|nr:hypothetical protein [Deltaproteobacteria bacterium]